MCSRRSLGRAAVIMLVLSLPALAQAAQGRLTYEVVHATSLEGNLLADSPDRSVLVYTPPEYDAEPGRRFAVLYLLHGFGATNTLWTGNGYLPGLDLPAIADRAMARPGGQPFIIVMPDCSNKFMGSFYYNSPVTGDWEGFVSDELVAYVDTHYRTIATAASRGLAGHSMGGFGTIHLGMNYPQTFSTLYAMSAPFLALTDWVSSVELNPAAWPPTLALVDYDGFLAASVFSKIHIATAAALSPNPGQPPFYGDLPYELVGGLAVPVPSVQGRQEAATPLAQLPTHLTQMEALRAIRFDAGSADLFQGIPLGCRAFSAALAAADVAHVYQEYDGDHFNRIAERLEAELLPFFATVLDHGARGLTVSGQTAGGRRRVPKANGAAVSSWGAVKARTR